MKKSPGKRKEAKAELMSKERIKLYLNHIDNPGFWMALPKEGRDPLKKKLIRSLKYYGIDIPEILR